MRRVSRRASTSRAIRSLWAVDAGPGAAPDHVFEFISKQLVGKPAAHGGDEFVDTERKFGLLYIDTGAGQSDLADQLRRRDAGRRRTVRRGDPVRPRSGDDPADRAAGDHPDEVRRRHHVVFIGDPVAPRDFTREATAQALLPGVGLAGSSLVDTTAFARTYDQDQWNHAFGITVIPARVLARPCPERAVLYEWFYGESPAAETRLNTDVLPAAVFFPCCRASDPT